MQATQSPGVPYVPLTTKASPLTLRRVQGLKALSICELLFAIYGILFISIYYAITIPVALIGLIAAARLNTTTLSVYAFLKVLLLGFVSFILVDVVYQYIDYQFDEALLMILLLAAEFLMQAICLLLATRLRTEILLAQVSTAAAASVELNSVSDSLPVQIPMQAPPQHFQDPHATAGMPGYPYPPHAFYPAMYMNQHQGYPMPYAPYPMMMMTPNGMPVPAPMATYPTFTMSEEQQPAETTHQ